MKKKMLNYKDFHNQNYTEVKIVASNSDGQLFAMYPDGKVHQLMTIGGLLFIEDSVNYERQNLVTYLRKKD